MRPALVLLTNLAALAVGYFAATLVFRNAPVAVTTADPPVTVNCPDSVMSSCEVHVKLRFPGDTCHTQSSNIVVKDGTNITWIIDNPTSPAGRKYHFRPQDGVKIINSTGQFPVLNNTLTTFTLQDNPKQPDGNVTFNIEPLCDPPIGGSPYIRN